MLPGRAVLEFRQGKFKVQVSGARAATGRWLVPSISTLLESCRVPGGKLRVAQGAARPSARRQAGQRHGAHAQARAASESAAVLVGVFVLIANSAG